MFFVTIPTAARRPATVASLACMGGLEVLCGPMFSGKTDELIARVRAAGRAVVFKPAVDTRHPIDRVVSHSGATVEAVSVADSAELLEAVADVDLVAIDEVQFF